MTREGGFRFQAVKVPQVLVGGRVEVGSEDKLRRERSDRLPKLCAPLIGAETELDTENARPRVHGCDLLLAHPRP